MPVSPKPESAWGLLHEKFRSWVVMMKDRGLVAEFDVTPKGRGYRVLVPDDKVQQWDAILAVHKEKGVRLGPCLINFEHIGFGRIEAKNWRIEGQFYDLRLILSPNQSVLVPNGTDAAKAERKAPDGDAVVR